MREGLDPEPRLGDYNRREGEDRMESPGPDAWPGIVDRELRG